MDVERGTSEKGGIIRIFVSDISNSNNIKGKFFRSDQSHFVKPKEEITITWTSFWGEKKTDKISAKSKLKDLT